MPTTYALLSTYPPTQCGLATFTAALLTHLRQPGKGIEHAIDSMALLRDRGLHVDYQVAGQTHPRVLERDGEAYRRALKARSLTRKVDDRVHFDDRFLPGASLLTEARAGTPV